jgi:putative ABC transport system ATP-binding protein
MLDMDHAGRVFGSGHLRVVALEGVSLQVGAGEFVAVMGPSGSGKSTLLPLAGGLDRPTSGRVLLAGRDLAVLDEARLAEALRREIGFVFQEANLLASLTAAENVALALELDGVKPKAAMAGARGLLDSFGLGAAVISQTIGKLQFSFSIGEAAGRGARPVDRRARARGPPQTRRTGGRPIDTR